MSNSNFYEIHSLFIDNITKENITTYINKYISDTIYIIQLQINTILSNNTKNNISRFYGEEDNDTINLIKKINNSLEKELFYLNNSKIKDISILIKVLTQRNELLNKLMIYFFSKQKIIQNKEIILNNKIKVYFENNKDNYITPNRNILNLNEYQKINTYVENIKKNNKYNFNKLSSYTILDINRIYNNQVYYYDNKKRKQKELKVLDNSKSIETKKNKNHLNKSFDMNHNFNDLVIINKENIKIFAKNNEDSNRNNNFKKIDENKNLKKRKVNSIVKKINNGFLITKIENNNNNPKINIKNIYQLNKLNLEKLNDISSNLLLI